MKYSNKTKEELFAECEARGGLPGITKDSSADEMIAALEAYDGTIRVPEHVVTRNPGVVASSPETAGDQSTAVFDDVNGGPVHVGLIESVSLSPKVDGRLIYVEGKLGFELMTLEQAKAKFAVNAAGAVVYNSRGFGNNMPGKVDIVKLILFNNDIVPKKETEAEKKARLAAGARAGAAKAAAKKAAEAKAAKESKETKAAAEKLAKDKKAEPAK